MHSTPDKFMPQHEPHDAEYLEEDAPEGNPSILHELHRLLRGRYHWAVLLGLLGLAGGAALGWQLAGQPQYRSQGIIRVAPTLPRVLYDNERNNMLPMFHAFVDSQATMIRSRRVVEMAMRDPDWQKLGRGQSDTAVARFISSLGAYHPDGSEMIYVTFDDVDQEAAVAGVKAAIAAYQKLYGERDVRGESNRLQILEQRRTALSNELKSLQDRILEVSNEYSADALAKTYTAKLDELHTIQASLTEVELAILELDKKQSLRDEKAADQGLLEKLTAQDMDLRLAAEQDSQVRAYLFQCEDLRVRLAGLRRIYGEGHWQITRTQAELEEAQARLEQAVEDFEAASTLNGDALAGGNIELLRARQAQLQTLKEDAEAKTEDLRKMLRRIEDLQQQVAITQEQLRQTQFRIESLTVESAGAGGRIEVITTGDWPLAPYRDDRVQLAGVGGLGGLMVGVGVIMLLGYLDQRLHAPDDAIRGADSRIIGILPDLPGDLTDPDSASAAAHAVHHLRTMLQVSVDPQRRHVLAVTSPAASDGKTSLCLALGFSFAAAGARTLLVDCDVIGGGLSAHARTFIGRKIGSILKRDGRVTPDQLDKALQIAHDTGQRVGQILREQNILTSEQVDEALRYQKANPVGLLEALAGEPLEDCTARFGLENLSILPLGAAGPEQAVRLDHAQLRNLFQRLRDQYDVVLVDTGPIAGSIEAAAVTATADGTVLVVSRGSRRDAVNDAMKRLVSVRARVLGCVFNRADVSDIPIYSSSTLISGKGVSQGRSRQQAEASGTTRDPFGPLAAAIHRQPRDDNGNGR